MRAKCCGLVAILMSAWTLIGSVQAHTQDTSYAQFKVARDFLECKFTYDLFTLVKIVPGLDNDNDHRVSDVELAKHASDVADFIRKHIQLEIDGATAEFGSLQPVEFPPDVGNAIPEQDYHAATSLVHFVFRQSLAKVPGDFWVQFNFFPDLGERHTVLGAIEQDGKEYGVIFRDYEPDYLFDTGYIITPSLELTAPIGNEDSVGSAVIGARKPSPRSNTNTTIWQQLGSYFWLGVEHIFLGFDHILFLLSLLVVCKFRELFKIVTSFTIAHTITLILATLEFVQLPSRFVETAIAATIVYVAVENFWIKETSHRWMLTFVFGLIHGFGFAGVLRELGLPTDGLVRSLISFNVGVEAGQLVIVCVLFPAIVGLIKWKHGQVVQRLISGLIALCGLGWFIDRAMGIGWMPF